MKILFSLTYYRPHVSGLTIYVQRLAEALASAGHSVTVLCSQHTASLPLKETIGGVSIIRLPVAFWISKGAIMKRYLPMARKLVRSHDLAVINLPNTFLEAGLLPIVCVLSRRPLVAVYHCDLRLPPGIMNRLIDWGVASVNFWSALLATRIVAYTKDYASHSPVLRRFPLKTTVIPPPVTIATPDPEQVRSFKRSHAPNGEKLIGCAARLAAEKGVEYLLEALPKVSEAYPGSKVLFAGDYLSVIGEGAYSQKVKQLLEKAGHNWVFLGVLPPENIGTFFQACDVTVLPSINSTESFGLVQVESMLCGTPVVASDLPGVRVPVTLTGMGEIVPPRDAVKLAEAIKRVLLNRDAYIKPASLIRERFSMETTLSNYEKLFNELMGSQAPRSL